MKNRDKLKKVSITLAPKRYNSTFWQDATMLVTLRRL